MKTYVVGGAVRDALLGLPVQDQDYVVVGATPELMLARGYTPVGKDFPVFLHPKTRAEYALARTERKTAPGYTGFVFHTSPDVTLEQDLARRDLTINAMARASDGELIDPYGGQQDLRDRILRHVSSSFAEDPVRILRLARFAARFGDFAVAPETMDLMRAMVVSGEVDALVPERVWQELARGLMERNPARMFEVLRACGALARILPELEQVWDAPRLAALRPGAEANQRGAHLMLALERAAASGAPLQVRFALLAPALGDEVSGIREPAQHSVQLLRQISQRLRVPNDCRDLAILAAREFALIAAAQALAPPDLVGLLERCDALRKPQRFAELLQAAACDWGADPDRAEHPFPQASFLEHVLAAATSIDAGAIATQARASHPDQPQLIPQTIRAARIAVVAASLRRINLRPEKPGQA